MWEMVFEVDVQLMRALKLKIAVKVVVDNYADTRCVIFANQLSRMPASFLEVVYVYIEKSLCGVVLIVV